MGGDDKSRVWNIRVTVSDKNPLERIQKWLNTSVTAHAAGTAQVTLACLEQEASQHVHASYECTKELCRSTIKQRISKFLDLSGNADFAMNRPKEDDDVKGLYRYICKGTGPAWETQAPAIIRNSVLVNDSHSLVQHNVQFYHKAFWTAQDEFKKTVREKAAQRDKEGIKQKYKIIAEVSEKNKNKKFTVQLFDQIVADVVEAYKGNVNDNTLFTACSAISYCIDPAATQLQACERMRKKFFFNYN